MKRKHPHAAAGDKHLASGEVSVRPCPRCRQIVFAGLAEGLHVRVDPTPLTPGAADAHAAAGHTAYVLHAGELVHRDGDRRRLAGVIFPEHRCPPKETP